MKSQPVPILGQKIGDVGTEAGKLIAKMSLALREHLRLRGRNPDAAVTPLAYAAVSPFSYANDTDFDLDVIVSGGTVDSVGFSRDGAAYYAVPTSGFVRLNPGDSVRVTFTVAPDITLIPR